MAFVLYLLTYRDMTPSFCTLLGCKVKITWMSTGHSSASTKIGYLRIGKRSPQTLLLLSHNKLWLLCVCISEITSRLTALCSMLHTVSSTLSLASAR